MMMPPFCALVRLGLGSAHEYDVGVGNGEAVAEMPEGPSALIDVALTTAAVEVEKVLFEEVEEVLDIVALVASSAMPEVFYCGV